MCDFQERIGYIREKEQIISSWGKKQRIAQTQWAKWPPALYDLGGTSFRLNGMKIISLGKRGKQGIFKPEESFN